MRALGLTLVLAGAMALGYQGFTYAGGGPPPLPQAVARRDKAVWVPPVVGGLSLISGVALLTLAGGRRGSL